MMLERVNEASEVPCIFLENLIYNDCTWEKVSLNWMPIAGVVATFMLRSFDFYPTPLLVLFLSFFLHTLFSYFMWIFINIHSCILCFFLVVSLVSASCLDTDTWFLESHLVIVFSPPKQSIPFLHWSHIYKSTSFLLSFSLLCQLAGK